MPFLDLSNSRKLSSLRVSGRSLIMLPLGLFLAASSALIAQSGPQASVQSTLAFGSIDYGTTTTLPLVVTNSGGSSLVISPSINGSSYVILSVAPATCLQGTPPGQTCTLTIQYSPVAIGNHNDALTLVTNTPSTPVVSLGGKATGVGVEEDDRLDFGTVPVNQTRVKRLHVRNLGVDQKVTVAVTVNGPSYKILNTPGSSCLFMDIDSGNTCYWMVEFAPGALGSHNSSLTVTPSVGAPSTFKIKGIAEPASAPPTFQSGNKYVVDANDSRVEIFNATNDFLKGYNTTRGAHAVALSSASLYIADCGIDEYDANNNLLVEFGTCNNVVQGGPGLFGMYSVIAVDSHNDPWIASDGLLQHFDQRGTFLGIYCLTSNSGISNCPQVAPFSIEAGGIAIDSSDNIYLTNDGSGPAVAKLDSTGKYLSSFGTIAPGLAPGHFYEASAIAFDSSGDIFVGDDGNNRVQEFDKSGTFLRMFGSQGTGVGEFLAVEGIATDKQGNVYVVDADYPNDRVDEFDPNGNYLGEFGSFGAANGQFYGPIGIAIVK